MRLEARNPEPLAARMPLHACQKLLLAPVVLLLSSVLCGCLPARCEELNNAGNQALTDKRYERAISYYSRSLAIEPDQDKVRLRLDSARTLLRQIYVDKIYEVVDRSTAPIGDYLEVWKMSARLPSLKVAARRVASIRADLSKRFARSEQKLRASTEGHLYFFRLSQMVSLVPDAAVTRARLQMGAVLRDQHLQQRKAADGAQRRGLALLHTAAAAIFSPRDTGLFRDLHGRRRALRKVLAIRLALRARAPGSGAAHLLGGLRRRLPAIFAVSPTAPLVLSLEARPLSTTQRQTDDRRNADCKVGTRRVPNPECPSLQRRAETARAAFESTRVAADAVAARCGQEQNANACASSVSSAQRRASDARRHFENLERSVGNCPDSIDKPVFKTFFYMIHTIYRQVTASAQLTLVRDGKALSSRGVQGSAGAQDSFGGGLGCANIPGDPLRIASLASLRVAAESRMLASSLGELLQLRRRKAIAQMAGGASQDERLDSLVRARLVDSTYALASQQLQRTLTATWGTDFGLTELLLK